MPTTLPCGTPHTYLLFQIEKTLVCGTPHTYLLFQIEKTLVYGKQLTVTTNNSLGVCSYTNSRKLVPLKGM